MLAVLGEDHQCGCGVAGLDCGDQSPVLGVDHLAIVRLVVVDGAVHLGGIPQQADQPHQPGKSAGVEDGEVHAPVRRRHGDHIGDVGRGPHIELCLLEPMDVLRGHLGHGDADSLGLEDLPDSVHLYEVRKRQLGDEVAAVGHVGDLALALEDLQRLAKRDPADAELDGQSVLDDLLART